MTGRTGPKLETLAAEMLDAARAAGADGADALVVAGTAMSVDVRAGALEHVERADGIDLGLRVLVGQRQACVSVSDTARDTIRTMAERAVAMAREAPVDPHAGLADPGQLAHDRDPARLELCDPGPEPRPDTMLAAALRTEAAALKPGIAQVDQASAAWSRRSLFLAASNGFAGGYARTTHSLSCVAITGAGTAMERDWAAESRVFGADLPEPEAVGALAAERTLARAGARRPPTGQFPVLYDERVAASLIGHLLSAINGTAIARGASWLRDALGQPVLPRGIDLVEQPLRPRGPASRPFDAEGLPVQERALVADGILQGWVLDLGTGRKLGLPSTGNAARGTSAPPAPTVSNVTVTPGTSARDDLIAAMGRGLLVTSFLGATVNPTTGDYSRGASGFWVENGQIAYPVNECTVAGNLRDMLRRILPANDARPHAAHRVPSLLVEGLTLAGG
ncbi:MAG: TldD/PmbA family protein [Gemmobacter sp.]